MKCQVQKHQFSQNGDDGIASDLLKTIELNR